MPVPVIVPMFSEGTDWITVSTYIAGETSGHIPTMYRDIGAYLLSNSGVPGVLHRIFSDYIFVAASLR